MQAPDPTVLSRLTETWFARHQRFLPWRDRYDPYEVWVSEVMLQQTRMEVVLKYYSRFLERFPTLQSLAAAAPDDVMAVWSGLGYYRRAAMLHAGAKAVIDRFGGRVPSTVAELLTLPGVGRYTAGAIASVAFDRHAPIVDGNVARIVSRLFAIDAEVGSPKLMRESWLREEQLVAACSRPRDFNQGLMELGALVCTPRKPACEVCPLRSVCAAYAAGVVEELPRPKAQKNVRELTIPLYLVVDRRGRLLLRRESGALMKAMYHLPHGNDSLLPDPLDAVAGDILGTFRHTVTTRRIEFVVHRATLKPRRVADARNGYEWIEPAEIRALPHPSYVAKALRIASL